MTDRPLLEGNSSRPLGVTPRAMDDTPDDPPDDPAPDRAVYLLRVSWDGADDGAVAGAFATRAAAEAALASRVRQARRHWLRRPWFDLRHLTTLPPDLFRDVVQDLGLEPPPRSWIGSEAGWGCWWAVKGPTMTEWQRQRFVSALDRLGGGRVVEVPLAG